MPRIDIPFVVENQIIKQTPVAELAAGGKNYFYATFTFNELWDDIENPKATFSRLNERPYIMPLTPIDGGYECEIPWEVMQTNGMFSVGVFGGDRLNTDVVFVKVICGCEEAGEEPKPPTPDWFDTIEEKCEDAVSAANDVKQRADEGEFDGEDGKTAYQYAVDGGYEGTEEDFAKDTARTAKAAETATKALEDIDEKISSSEQFAKNTFANALKGKKTGGAITTNGVSPIEHELKVKASNNGDIADITTANVLKYGGNLLDIEGREVVSFGANSNTTKRSFTGNGIILGFSYNNYYNKGNVTSFEKHKNGFSFSNKENQNYYGVGFDFKGLPNTTYVAYFDGITNSSSFVSEYDKDGNFLRGTYSSGWEGSARKLTTKENTAWIVVSFQNQPSALAEVVDYNNVYIGIDTFTEFEEYKEPTIHPISADGTVEGVTSIYPTTTLTSDTEGIVLDVEYNRDINKAFEELTRAIISLGGNV